MSFSTWIKRLIFPPRCVLCTKVLDREAPLCADCERELVFTGYAGARTKGEFFSGCVSPLFYDKNVRQSLLRYKFSGKSSYAEFYGALIADCVREHYPEGFDLISWVPLSRKRLRKRGYDQARLLAESSAAKLGGELVPVLKKKRDIPAQSGIKGAEKRRANVLGVYECVNAEMIRGKRILLIDDIVTTGATLSECARTLKMSGAGEVICATAAKAR